MDLDGSDVDEGSTGVLVLHYMSVMAHFFSPRPFTYKASGTDPEVGGRLANRAVGSGEDGVLVQERGTAEVRTRALKADNEGEVASVGSNTTNNVVVVVVPVVGVILGNGSSRDEGGGREGSDDAFGVHGGEEEE